MSRKARTALFLVCVPVFLALYLRGLAGLPPAGRYRGPYGDIVNRLAPVQRHVTNAVTAVNFDFRAMDTLGEEFILFTSVMGVSLILRRMLESDDRQENDGGEARAREPLHGGNPPSDADRAVTLAMAGLLSVFGVYVISHGPLTPGGGFQGGVILAAAPLQVFLAAGFAEFRRAAAHGGVEILEALGAGGYALVGAGAVLAGGAFLQNTMPLGNTGAIFSGGSIGVINAAVGVEVAGGFLILLRSFLEEKFQGGVERGQ